MNESVRRLANAILDGEEDDIKREYGIGEPDYDLSRAERDADAQGHSQEASKNVLRRFLAKRKVAEARQPIPVQIRRPDGSVIDAEFDGYWDLGIDTPSAQRFGKRFVPNIGYDPSPTSHGTHGLLHTGEEILTPVPSPEEWNKEEPPTEPPAKACFWPTM